MVKKIRVGIIYSHDKDYVAFSYYILNLIHALNLLEDKDKPHVFVLSDTLEEYEEVKKTNYPYLKFKKLSQKKIWNPYNFSDRLINKVSRTIAGKNLINKKVTSSRLSLKLDLLFPSPHHIYFSSIKNRLYWIPDFQEHFLPQFFSKEEITDRKQYQQELADNASPIVFSSNTAAEHFTLLYPKSKSSVNVLQFAVTHPDYKTISKEKLFRKYEINEPYFFCPNQFWAHKNHITVLKAIKSITEKHKKKVLVVFSGKEFDYRDKDFFSTLKTFVHENKIEEHVKFLGFIDRGDQLQLMNNSIAVIQPSLFEGWSTVIEDAKAMSKYIIASDLPVHREQLSENVSFFESMDSESLAELMIKFQQSPPVNVKIDYSENVVRFGKTFLKIAEQIIGKTNRA